MKYSFKYVETWQKKSWTSAALFLQMTSQRGWPGALILSCHYWRKHMTCREQCVFPWDCATNTFRRDSFSFWLVTARLWRPECRFGSLLFHHKESGEEWRAGKGGRRGGRQRGERAGKREGIPILSIVPYNSFSFL